MNAVRSKSPENLRMSEREFDQIMHKALQVKPQASKPKTRSKPKARKKKQPS